MKTSNLTDIPREVLAIAALFALCGIYLVVSGLIMLLRPGLIGMSSGAPLLFGLELAGPWMFVLIALVGFTVALGLVREINVARRAAILIAVAGIVMLVPAISAAAVMVEPRALFWNGSAIIVRVIVAWYLSQRDIADQFKTPKNS